MLLDTPSPAENRRPTVVALEFWRDYEPDRENPGNMRAVDWVRWARRGDLTYATNEDKISRISKPMRAGGEGGGQEENPVWLGIRGAYEAWKSGQETPVDGTPLDAWPALTKVQVEAFRAAQYRTIEDVAEITDGQLGRVRLPDMRQLRDKARTYIANKANSAAIEVQMAERDRRLETMEQELAEARAALARLAGDEPRRGPGRPRKAGAEAVAEEAA